MSNLEGRQKIGKIGSSELFINFDDLFRFKGSRGLKDNFDRALGTFSLSVGILFNIIGVLFFLAEETETTVENFFSLILSPTEIFYLLPWISMALFLYGAYLLRSKNRLGYSFEELNLGTSFEQLKEGTIREMELENFFTERILVDIDTAYTKDSDRFIQLLSLSVLKEKITRQYFERRLGINLSDFKSKLIQNQKDEDLSFNTNYQKFFLGAIQVAIDTGAKKIHTDVLFISLALDFWRDTFKDFDINELDLRGLKLWIGSQIKIRNYKRKWRALSRLKPRGAVNKAFTSKRAPFLDLYGTDLTRKVIKDGMIVSLGKENTITQILQTLSKETEAAALLIGEPGVGKTYLLHDLATKTVIEDLPKELQDHRLISVNLNNISAVSLSIDEFRNILTEMMEEAMIAGNIILVFEEIDQIFSIRQDAKMEVINLIINMINDHRVKIIATSSRDSFYRSIRPVSAFTSLFNVIELLEPDDVTTFQILMDYVEDYEKDYRVEILTSSIRRIIQFSSKFNYEKSQPDKGLDLLEEALVRASDRGLEYLDDNIVNEVIKEKIGIDVGKIGEIEGQKLEKLEELLHERVIGQNRAVRAVASALRRARSGLNSGKRPVASFLFYGPTGVGKTQVAKTVSEVYYGDEKLMVRLDMSEYQEFSNLDRLIGYTDSSGEFVGGSLTEAVRTRPFSLVLLDEIEKANPKVLDLFLQILDEGNVTDGMGRDVDFTNTIIVATSNAGSRKIANLIEKKREYKEIEKATKEELRDVFRVEFLNRFDKVIMFEPLKKIEILQIADILLADLNENLDNKNIQIEWNRETLAELSEKGYDPVYGARELRRVIQDEIEDKIALLIVQGRLKSGQVVSFRGLEVGNIR